MLEILDFKETEHAIESTWVDVHAIDVSKLTLLVKAHEKEIYDLNDHMIVAKPHRDNEGDYPFSKLDFLSHQLMAIIFPLNVPKVYAASFKNNQVFYVLEKVPLDPLHQAYNVYRQKVHQKEGLDYQYNPDFLKAVDMDEHVKRHNQLVLEMQKKHENNLKTYGITFDHSHVNITWRNQEPVALELHKCQRSYLFDYDQCLRYFTQMTDDDSNKTMGLTILKRIKTLEKVTPKE